MHRRILSLVLIGFLGIVIINWSCTKLDTTNLGSDLIPIVDNVNTFADTLNVEVAQNEYTDTTIVNNGDNHVLGNINFDPLFGKTTGSVFLQLKPAYFPFSFGSPDSIVGLDSVVLCLNYKGFWGDSNAIQTVQAFEVVDNYFKDSSTKVWPVSSPAPVTGNPISAQTNVDIRRLSDLMYYAHVKDSVSRQIRIKIDPSYGFTLFNSDSTITGSGNHAFYNDSTFKKSYNGIAVKGVSSSANAMMYVNLADTNTKLEFHYRIKNLGKIDTTYKSFKLITATTATVRISRTANNILRDRSGTPSATPIPNGDIYLQAQPGTFASIKIPRLSNYSNRIIHRAELIVEQVPTDPLSDSLFAAPNYLYLDLKDSGTALQYKPIYYDLNPGESYNPDLSTYYYPTSGPDFSYYGGFVRRRYIPGGSVVYYNINISRYVQRLVINQGYNYEMRLFPAFQVHYGQYASYVPYGNDISLGRIKIGGGNNPDHKMQVRIIYSNIK